MKFLHFLSKHGYFIITLLCLVLATTAWICAVILENYPLYLLSLGIFIVFSLRTDIGELRKQVKDLQDKNK